MNLSAKIHKNRTKSRKKGRLAQLVERHSYKVDVISSSLIATTIWITENGLRSAEICAFCGAKSDFCEFFVVKWAFARF